MSKIMRNVYLESEQIEWLAGHEDFNLSGFVRKELEKKIKGKA